MYERFARWYDRLTGNVDYAARADYFEEIIARHRRGEGKLLLDLACGTGTLSLLLAQRGWDVIGVDGSGDMLAQAQAKAAMCEARPLFLCQEMEEEPHRYEDSAEDTDPDCTTPSGVRMTPLMVPPRKPPLMMAVHAQMVANRRGNGRTGARTCSAPSSRNLLKCPPVSIQ